MLHLAHDCRNIWKADPRAVEPHALAPAAKLASPAASVLDRARDAAQGKDVRLGGGATTIRQFLDAGLVDTMHVAVSQVELGSGSRLWESPDELLDRFHLEVMPSPSGVTHHLYWRRCR